MSLHSQYFSFIIIGIISVSLDFILYLFLLFLGLDTVISKSISFAVVIFFPYYANRKYTFNSSRSGPKVFVSFIMLNLVTLIVNVTSNEVSLHVLGTTQYMIILSFIIATSVSALLNFLGMRYIVFKK